MEEKIIKLIVQLYRISTTKDGGSRITLDAGAESLQAIQEMQRLSAMGDTSFAIAVVPFVG